MFMRLKKGSATAYALIIVVAMMFLLVGIMQFITSRLKAGKYEESRQQAFEIAEAGLFYYRWYLAHQTDGRTAQQIDQFWSSGTALGIGTPHEAEYKDPWGAVLGRYSISVTPPVAGSTIAMVSVQGWTYAQENLVRTIRVRFRRPSWSEDVVLSDDNIRFGNGTTITGRIHSNKGIRFDGVATGLITSTLNTYNDPDHIGGNEIGVHTHKLTNGTVNDSFRAAEANPASIPTRLDVFQAGRRINMPEIPFANVVSDLGFMRSEAAIKYDNTGRGRKITLKTDGTFDVCKVNSYSAVSDANYNANTTATNAITDYAGIVTGATGGFAVNNGTACVTTSCCKQASCPNISGSASRGRCVSMTSDTIPNNGVIFVANNVWIDGQVNGKKVTVVAAELTDEPSYTGGLKNIFIGTNNLTYTNHDGTDIIGLVAQDNITVVRDSQNNLEIDGALLAQSGRVGRCYYNGITKNSITINGSLATKIRYGFAYVDNTGYQIRNLNFDDNLLYYPPPYFPTGSQYAVDLWEEL